jgi:hypothetical protein
MSVRQAIITASISFSERKSPSEASGRTEVEEYSQPKMNNISLLSMPGTSIERL